MINISVKTNTAKARAALKNLEPAILDKVFIALKKDAAQMEREIKKELSIDGKLAARGPRGEKRRKHSSPGEPPFLQTGNLRAAIGYEVTMRGKNTEVEIGAIRGGKEINYARDLELGSSTIAKRPFLMPVITKHLAKLKELFKIEFKAIIPK